MWNIRRVSQLLVAVTMLIMTASCDLHTSDNGDLDGYWHLIGVDTLTTGGHLNLSEKLVFWGVQANLVEAVDYGNDATHYGYIFYFRYDGDRLHVYNVYRHDRANGDVKVENVADIAPLGLNQLEIWFSVVQLNGSTMILADDFLRLTFRKQ